MKRLFFAFLLLTLLTTTAHAMDNEALIDLQSEALGTDQLEGAIPQEARDLLGDSDMTGTSFDQGLERIFQNVMRMLGGVFREAARSAALVLVIALLAGLVNSMYGGGGEGVPNYVPLVGVLAVATVAVGSGGAFIGLGARTLYELETFAQTLFPAMTLAGAASGAVTSAAVKYAGTMLFFNLLLTITTRVIMPLIYAYIAASIGSAAMGGEGLKSAANLLKWVAGVLITTIMIAFVGYLTVTGVVAGSADVVTTRVAKTTISTVLPVVGGIVADAAETVLAGAMLVRNGMGVAGLLVVLAICLIPILQLGAHYLMFKAAAGLSGAVTDARVGGLIDNLGTAFGMVMGLTGAGAMMMFFSILSMMRVVIR
ncbi:MAG: stage III sporulation protein AE [Oscillospiraceae bacterium]|nr:stage III sporulation protein AE [Oscillospiraceae bacterium]